MKHPFTCRILPWFPLGAGALGLILRLWLFASTDEKGLLPTGHIADSALYILTALALGILFLATRELKPRALSSRFLRLADGIGCLLGGLGLFAAALLDLSQGAVRLAFAAMIACILGGIAMFLMAALRFLHKKPPYWLPAIVTVALMLDTVAQGQTWGAVPQLQAYFFPLLAAIFLIMSAYHATALAADRPQPRQLAFFSQAAAFLCCLSLNTAQAPLYLGMAFWAAAQLYPCMFAKKEA